MKTGKLNQSEKDFIKENKNKTLAFLCKKLDRSEKVVSAFLDTLPEDAPVAKVSVNVKDMFAKNRGAVIMTPAVAEISDVTNKGARESKYNNSSCIHKIN